MRLKKIFFTTFFLVGFFIFTLYSYAFLDTGLTLTSFKPYLEFQKQARLLGNSFRQFSAFLFLSLSLILYFVYLSLIKLGKKNIFSLKNGLYVFFGVCFILIFAYPAFSHDIFNYIFNAKIVLIFKSDPHVYTAWEFADPMLDFMRNVHTPAPYFYGWTIMSLLPFTLSFGQLFLSLINFKLFSLFFYFLTFLFLKKIAGELKLKNKKERLLWFLLNPLLLIEAVGVGHNDFSMMSLLLMSFYNLILFKKSQNNLKKVNKSKKDWLFLFFSCLFFLLSVSIKYATVVLVPLFFIFYFKKDFDLGFWSGFLLFLLPLTRPINQLHSWYFIWSFTMMVLARKKETLQFFVLISFFALLRYFPYIWQGDWNSPVPVYRWIIYYFLPLFFLPVFILKKTKIKKT